MNTFTRMGLAAAAAAAVMFPLMAHADLPGSHPGYLHALTDLRTARWLLEHQPGDNRVYANEDLSIMEVDAAIQDIKQAAIEDGKDLRDHPAMDAPDHGSRLLRAIEALKKARGDIGQEEDNPAARELRRSALQHIDRSLYTAERAHVEWLRDVRR